MYIEDSRSPFTKYSFVSPFISVSITVKVSLHATKGNVWQNFRPLKCAILKVLATGLKHASELIYIFMRNGKCFSMGPGGYKEISTILADQ